MVHATACFKLVKEIDLESFPTSKSIIIIFCVVKVRNILDVSQSSNSARSWTHDMDSKLVEAIHFSNVDPGHTSLFAMSEGEEERDVNFEFVSVKSFLPVRMAYWFTFPHTHVLTRIMSSRAFRRFYWKPKTNTGKMSRPLSGVFSW